MVFIRERHKGSAFYYQLVESKREGNKVSQKVLKHFRSRKEMLDYCKKHGIETPKTSNELIDSETAKRIEEKLGILNKRRPLKEDALKRLKTKFEVEMTYNSNAIEGNRLSLRETFLVLERGITIGGRSMKDHLEATNHKDAINFIEKLVKNKELSETDILEIHALVLDKIAPADAGVYRHEPVYIVGSKHMPPNWKLVPEKMKEVINEINSKEKGVKAIESAAKLHHLIASIHPFIDGNGRTARLLTNLRLMRAGFPPIILQKKIRRSYYNALEKADDGEMKQLTYLTARDVEKALDLWLEAAN